MPVSRKRKVTKASHREKLRRRRQKRDLVRAQLRPEFPYDDTLANSVTLFGAEAVSRMRDLSIRK